ncbi:hypothetical protein M9H77_14577 [Catharanthus roseus]|uniref:Uncharacterized protein n=1 Tax=Catharanthus roseus TaxID=4058 RepID=A0ACC0BNK4_CATRO|nr:hypothetical protein M9H77_14577 [Catharanthus roseus]
MQLLFSRALPMVLNTVIKLNVFEIIAREGPNAQLSPFQIRVYGLGTVSKYFVKNENGSSLGAAVLDGGILFERAHRMPIYKYAGLDQKFNETFNVSMLHQIKMVVANIIENYKGFENLKTLVDVGDGAGIALSVITSKFPNIKGINYDLPHVILHAPKYPGVEHIGALPENGNLIVVDAIIPMNPDNRSSTKHTAQVDMFILLNQQLGVKERTKQEFFTLATKAGFKGIQKKCVFFDLWVMEFNK